MAQHTLQQRFEAAAGWLTSTPAAAALPNNTKLEIYGLYKFVTAGKPSGSRPSIFYPAPRAKYDSWVAIHTQYTDPKSTLPTSSGSASSASPEDKARERYIVIAKEVGWTNEGLQEEEEIDFDEEDEAPRADSGSKGPKGMGPRVSVMAQEEKEEAGEASALHDAVVDDRLEDVKRLLHRDKTIVNDKDEFGNTALHLAVDRGFFDIVQVLLLAGADKAALDEDKQTPLDIAKVLDRDDLIALLQ